MVELSINKTLYKLFNEQQFKGLHLMVLGSML